MGLCPIVGTVGHLVGKSGVSLPNNGAVVYCVMRFPFLLSQQASYHVAHREQGGVISFTREEAFLVILFLFPSYLCTTMYFYWIIITIIIGRYYSTYYYQRERSLLACARNFIRLIITSLSVQTFVKHYQ